MRTQANTQLYASEAHTDRDTNPDTSPCIVGTHNIFLKGKSMYFLLRSDEAVSKAAPSRSMSCHFLSLQELEKLPPSILCPSIKSAGSTHPILPCWLQRTREAWIPSGMGCVPSFPLALVRDLECTLPSQAASSHLPFPFPPASLVPGSPWTCFPENSESSKPLLKGRGWAAFPQIRLLWSPSAHGPLSLVSCVLSPQPRPPLSLKNQARASG